MKALSFKKQTILPLIALLIGGTYLAAWAQNPPQGYVSPVEQLPLPPPEQPIPYSHKKHVGELQLACDHCHKIDKDGFLMEYPSEQVCMACHQAIKTDSPHIQKLTEFAAAGKAVPWVQIYKVPDYVWFAHDSHTSDAGVECADCHGPVGARDKLFKEKATNMVACMDCHQQHGAPNDCDLCHDPG